MGEKSDQIERQITAERGQLGQNLNELQSKVQEVTDWRVQFQKRPMLMMGVALGGGLLLATMTGRRSRSSRSYAEHDSTPVAPKRLGSEVQKNKALETFDTIKGAMIGVAANTVRDFFGQLIPGFHEEFRKTAQQQRSTISGSQPPATASLGQP